MSGPHGPIIVGGCRLEAEIGRGGAGTVYRALQLAVNRPVAVKLVPVDAESAGWSERFQREAEAAGALDHPHCLPVYAAGEQDGLLYLVMRLVDGPDLAALIRREGPLAPERAVGLIEQVAGAVDHAHQAGLVHRDLKPANILIERRGNAEHAYVSDFGLMRSLAETDAITLSGQWVGTPQFAAPEQQRGESVGPSADIYGLGGVLAAALGPSAPPRLEAVVARALDPVPARRYASASALARAARGALGPRPTRSRRGPVIFVGASAVVIAAVAAAIVLTQSTSGGPGRSSTGVSRPDTGTEVVTGTAGSTGATTPGTGTSPPASSSTGGTALETALFSADLPGGWLTTAREQSMTGFHRSTVESPSGQAIAHVDRSSNPGGSLLDYARNVMSETQSTTSGYAPVSFGQTTLSHAPVVIWAFTLAGHPQPQRVDVFRRLGGELFAVVATSSSQHTSRRAADTIAGSLTLR